MKRDVSLTFSQVLTSVPVVGQIISFYSLVSYYKINFNIII